MTDKYIIAREQYILELEARIRRLEEEYGRLLKSEEKFTTVLRRRLFASFDLDKNQLVD